MLSTSFVALASLAYSATAYPSGELATNLTDPPIHEGKVSGTGTHTIMEAQGQNITVGTLTPADLLQQVLKKGAKATYWTYDEYNEKQWIQTLYTSAEADLFKSDWFARTPEQWKIIAYNDEGDIAGQMSVTFDVQLIDPLDSSCDILKGVIEGVNAVMGVIPGGRSVGSVLGPITGGACNIAKLGGE